MTTKATTSIARGDAPQVALITVHRKMNGGRGYSRAYVYEVLHGTRKNESISAIHAELVALRTPKRSKR